MNKEQVGKSSTGRYDCFAYPGDGGRFGDHAFGNLSYDREMSKYEFEYQKISLEESVKRTETE